MYLFFYMNGISAASIVLERLSKISLILLRPSLQNIKHRFLREKIDKLPFQNCDLIVDGRLV
jgi:hypothetical protein